MMADDFVETAKQQAQQSAEIIVPAVTDKIKAGAGAMMDIMKGVASMPASALASHFMYGNHQTSLATLQRQMGGDLHPLAIAPELERYLKADLRRRGVNFSLEKAPDGNTYVHFSGRDVDTVQHGLKQSAARYERRVAKFDAKAFKREVKARKKVNKVMKKQHGKVAKSLSKSQKAAVKADNAQVKANKARYKANKQLAVAAQSSPEKRARAIKKYMRLNGRANDKISRAQYKAIRRIDRVRKWRMKKLKQSFNQGLPQPVPQQGLPGQPVPGQPMPQPVNQPMPGQPVPGQPVPGQPVPQQGLPQQPFPHSRSRASTFTGPGQRAPQPMPQPVNQPMPGQQVPGQGLPGQPMPQQSVPQQPVPQPVNQPVPGQPVPGQPVPGQPMPGQPMPGQPVPPQPMPQPIPEPVPPRPMPQPMPQEGLPQQALPQPMPQPVPGQAWLTPEVLSQVPSQPMPQQGLPGQALPQPVNQPVPGQQSVPQPVNQPVPQRAPQPVPGQRAPKGVPGQPKYSKSDVTKAMDQRKQQILEEAKKAKPTRTPTHTKGAR